MPQARFLLAALVTLFAGDDDDAGAVFFAAGGDFLPLPLASPLSAGLERHQM